MGEAKSEASELSAVLERLWNAHGGCGTAIHKQTS